MRCRNYNRDDLMWQLSSIVKDKLSNHGFTLAVAESCTGGLLSEQLTSLSGSSRFFLLGVVTYTNEAKVSVLNVSREIIDTQGAVSAEVAKAMVDGVKKMAGSDIGIAVTGIAGPQGGTPEKPVGIVYVAVDFRGSLKVTRLVFNGSRRKIRTDTVVSALKMLLSQMQ